MSDFELAVAKTIKNEGGGKYTDYPNDRGGATKYGISLRFLKTLKDHEILKFYGNNINSDVILTLTEEEAKHIYKKYFWDSNRYGEIEDQAIADKVFDMAVLMGAPQANKCLQQAKNDSSFHFVNPGLEVDGIIGDKSLLVINCSLKGSTLWDLQNCLTVNLTKKLISICNKDKTQSQYLLGWLNRVMS